MSCIIRYMSTTEAATRLNEICINDIIMNHPVFDLTNRLHVLKMPLYEKTMLVSILTGMNNDRSIKMEDDTLIPTKNI